MITVYLAIDSVYPVLIEYKNPINLINYEKVELTEAEYAAWQEVSQQWENWQNFLEMKIKGVKV